MKTTFATQRNTYSFNITKNDVNENKKLTPSVLYTKMQAIATNSLKELEADKSIHQYLFKLNMLKNASLRDRLKITHTVQKYNDTEIVFSVRVSKENSKENPLICDAIFGFKLLDKVALHSAS
ncbi:hypothetical protein [Flavicella marina]|uniref:hypothetical protein n=1 Tax=Flavicella marina TaxID=1475951 RepID=UPI0012652F2A|nr:hypothetical protein [Flavicella marina]